MDWKLRNQIADEYEAEDNYAKDFDEIPDWVVDNLGCSHHEIIVEDDVSEISINSDRYVSSGAENEDEPKVDTSKHGLDPSNNNENDKNSTQVGAVKMEVVDIKIENESTGSGSGGGGEPKVNASKQGLDPSNNIDDTKSAQLEIPKIEAEVDDIKSYCSSNSDDSTAKNQSLFGDTSDCSLNSFKTKKCKVLIANCKQYQPSKKIRGISKRTSNFQKHLKSDHVDDELSKNIPSEKVQLYEETNSTIRQVQSNQNSLPSTSAASRLTKAAKTCPTANVAVLLNTKIQFNENVLNYFLTSFTPLDFVESPEFWAMFNHTEVTMPCISKKHLITQIEMKFNTIKNKIITLLEGVDFVCISIDVWTSKLHYFHYSAITCHWIDSVTLKRRSVALACKNLDATLDSLKFLNQTLKEYKMSKHKIISIVTKNFYNFSNIFKVLNINTPPKIDTIDEEPSFIPYKLEKETYICYTNTLSLIATIDIPKLMDSYFILKQTYDWVLKKVFLFLFLASSDATLAPLLADLKKPDVVKWNSIHHSFAYFLKLEQKFSFVEMTELLKIEPFTEEEIEYLKQYVNSLRPLALAFERLQSEAGSYHGYILPTLVELRKRCEQLIENKQRYRSSDRKQPMTATQLENLIVFEPFLYTIRSKCLERFFQLLTPSPEADLVITASMSHPFFKDKWVPALGLQKHIVTSKFIEAVKKENSKSNDAVVNVKVEDKLEDQIDDFYFGEDHPEDDCSKGANISLELEVLRYLGDNRRNLKMLNDYPAVKRVFIKYNTSLSSSDAIEKLFPYEIRQNIANYGTFNEDIFEQRILVIVNKDVLLS